MTHTHTIVGHFPSHAEAERVVLELQKVRLRYAKAFDHWQRLPNR